MKIKGIIGLILLLAGIGHAALFQGEVYKIDKYSKSVTLRGADLSMINNGQTLFICDENNKQVATVKITRYYTTIIETTLLTGDLSVLKVKMPVYQDAAQFQNRKPVTVVRYEQDYDYYWWQLIFVYNTPNGEFTKEGKVIFPSLIEIMTKGYDEPAKIDPSEVAAFILKGVKIRGLRLTRGKQAELDKIDFRIPRNSIPAGEETITEDLGKRTIKIGPENLIEVRLIKRIEGIEESAQTVAIRNPVLETKVVGGIEFVHIPAGEFMMGHSDPVLQKFCPLHQVVLGGFWLAKYELTQAQWKDVMGGNPSPFKGDDFPVEKVTWNGCRDFCLKFNKKYGANIRFPTEAEWEYACRAESTTKYYWGDDFDPAYSWDFYDAKTKEYRHPVGQKRPNDWGLYDMIGGVWEYCQDRYDEEYYQNSPVNDPQGPSDKRFDMRVNRGHLLDSAWRERLPPTYTESWYGFRPAMSEE